MKPIKMTISAFGSYADEQVVNFSELGECGLYLITGDTGSGKTTIFDAISFALYGEASGKGRDRYQMLRSDFAPDNIKTFVELVFSSGENIYTIKRIIKNFQDVSLVLPDGTVETGDRKIKPKIAEIIGLDKEQFAQIVMIAQNDFLRFLHSGTNERLGILRRIFNTQPLKNFQERLKQMVSVEERKIQLILHDFARYEVNIHSRDSLFVQWEEEIKTDTGVLAGLNDQLDSNDKKRQKLAAEIAIAEAIIRNFSDLAQFKASLEALYKKADEIATIEKSAIRGEIALRKVKPLADSAQLALGDLKNAEQLLQIAKENEETAKAKFSKAVETIKSLPVYDEKLTAYNETIKVWEIVCARLDKMRNLKNDKQDIEAKQRTLQKNQSEFELINDEFDILSIEYAKNENTFLKNQAGILAGQLKDGVPCPVCGSKEHPAPAQLTGDDISEEILIKARDKRDKIQVKREEISTRCGALKTEIDTLAKLFVSGLSELAELSGFGRVSTLEEAQEVFADCFEHIKKAESDLLNKKEEEKTKLDELEKKWETAHRQKSESELSAKTSETLSNEREENVRKHKTIFEEKQTAFLEGLSANSFIDEPEYLSILITDEELNELNTQVQEHKQNEQQLVRDIKRLEAETKDKTAPDVVKLRDESDTLQKDISELREKRDDTLNRLNSIKQALKELKKASVEYEKAEKVYASVKQLSDVANGRLDFETYAQMAYFDRVLRAASLRLHIMSQNRFTLTRKSENFDGRKRSGLEIEVFDAYTGKTRAAESLSGGESFMASLSLALGLSDVVQQNVGGVRLDAMFIDEGFGTLDNEVLELAIKTLSEMAGSNRIIGIISHVTELRDRIDKQIQIDKTNIGSKIHIIA